MSVVVARRLFNVEEYHQMAAAGILGEDDRVELIHGEIIEMSPIGSPHIACVNRLTALLSPLLGENGILSIQNPVGIDNYSEPEPDVAILQYRPDFYEEEKPGPKDVLLIIEVADNTLMFDKKVKMPLYAEAGIPEMWLVDLNKKNITVYTTPLSNAYLNEKIYLPGESVFLQSLPKLSINVADLFWKK